jgi:hypothetical protein
MATDIEICSLGCMQVGGKPLNSFDTPGDVTVFLKARYPILRDYLISVYPWEAFKVRKEATLAAGNPGGYAYQFVIPPDAVGPPIGVYASADAERGISDYEVRGNRIVANVSKIWVEYTARRPETEWPAWFTNMVMAAVSAEVAFLISDQASLTEEWRTKAYGTPSEGGLGGLLGQCMVVDAQGSGNNPGISDDAFIAARFGAWPGANG